MMSRTTRANTDDRRRLRKNLQVEIDNSFLYSALAAAEPKTPIAAVYRSLAEAEAQHAAMWGQRFRDLHVEPPAVAPSWRARVLAAIGRRFGAAVILPTLIEGEREMGRAARQVKRGEGVRPSGQEIAHARVLEAILNGGVPGVEGAQLAQLEGRHRAIGGNALRAAVLGANDGLVSNLSLVMGVAGAAISDAGIVIAGFAGLLAGSISMALGEWLSVQSSRELYARQIAIESEELELSPEDEARELALIYRSKGLPEEQANALAVKLIADPREALDTLAREELGIEPETLGGSAWIAAFTSFLLFAFGAIIPVLPFVAVGGGVAVMTSLVLSAVGLFGLGAAITLMTGRGVLFSGFRQTIFGLAAAAVTFGIGHLLGVALAG
jgi:VIT1/CCC1 family predicted Fe2+/Mn2+ transporter